MLTDVAGGCLGLGDFSPWFGSHEIQVAIERHRSAE